jgi:hypothetical protein
MPATRSTAKPAPDTAPAVGIAEAAPLASDGGSLPLTGDRLLDAVRAVGGTFDPSLTSKKETFPNLAGVVTKDLIESIGTGKYAAAYVNWSRTQNLLHEHAPGWAVEAGLAPDGTILHKAPAGGYLSLRYVHTDGRATPFAPQAVMDNRNNAIPYEKITARDITDTHRRGSCLAAALFFGLAYELWAKIEVGYPEGDDTGETPVKAAVKTATAAATAVTKDAFLAAATERGLSTFAAEALASKLNGNYAGGIERLKEKDDAWVKDFNEASAPKDEASKY